MRGKSIYADLYVKYSHRALRTPRVARPWRPRVIAWAGPTAFMRDRFYELDSWYKARIHKPELLPKLHLIDPDAINYTLKDRLKVTKNRTINVGFKYAPRTVPKASSTTYDAEKLSRKNLLEIDINERIVNDLDLMDHYHIFQDLFAPGVYFYNTQYFDVFFSGGTDENGSHAAPFFPHRSAYYGNILRTSAMRREPTLNVERVLNWTRNSGTPGYGTLLMLNIDGDAFTDYEDHTNVSDFGRENSDPPSHRRRQILHWLVANVADTRPTDHVDAVESIIPYLQPLPFYGTGYHRIVFILLRHVEKIDFRPYFSDFSPTADGAELLSRRFDMNAFLKYFEDRVTPTSLKFCQVKWDESCDEKLHKMGIKSPRYWYAWNQPLKPEQKEFPMKPMPFHHYLNMYRPPEKVRREVARQRLDMLMNQPETADGEEERVEKPAYPDMFYQENIKRSSRWIHQELIRRNVGLGPYAALYDQYVNPAEQNFPSDKNNFT